jgi:hypothetical protein
VADYTAILSQRLVEVSDTSVEPVLVPAGKSSVETIEVGFPVVDVSGKQSDAMVADTVRKLAGDANGHAMVLLEYVGYGYAKRGAPLWLVRGLSRVCGEDGVPLVTMVHEVRASNWKPWTSTFWLSPVQGYIAAQLARMSRAVVTNRIPSAQWLRSRTSDGTTVHVQPVFSNVGEPERIPPFDERSSQAVVFGGGAMKNRLYDTLEHSQRQLLRDLSIDRIVDLGATDGIPDSVAGIPVDGHGIQPASTISAQLQQARIGLLQYPVDYLTKSGIWASYAAHGLPSLVISDPARSDPLEENCHFLRANPDGELSEKPDLKGVGNQARRWYQSHAHSKQAARTFDDLVRS